MNNQALLIAKKKKNQAGAWFHRLNKRLYKKWWVM